MLPPQLYFIRKATACLHSFIPICAGSIAVGMVIDMFFRNRFIFRKFKIFDPVIVSDTQVYYYAIYGDYHMRAVATIQDFSEDGEIQRMVVRPA